MLDLKKKKLLIFGVFTLAELMIIEYIILKQIYTLICYYIFINIDLQLHLFIIYK